MRKTGILALVVSCGLAAAPGELADAAQNGQWANVRSLLAAKDDVKSAQADGMTALHWAVQANQADVVAALLSAGADPNAANRHGITPLWLAATNGSAGVTRALLKAGASVSLALPHGETALMAAARTGEPETIQVLLDAGADPNAQETSQGETGLMWAAAENHPEAIRVLIRGGADPDKHAKGLDLAPMKWMQVGMVDTMLPRGGFTALMYAARQDAQDAAKALAEMGADLNAKDPDGTTAVLFAIINQHYDMAALLLEKGADPNAADASGVGALYAAVDMNTFRSDIGRPARQRMDRLTALDVAKLAIARGADVNAQLKKPMLGRHHGFPDASLGDGATALMRAAKSMDTESFELLMAAGANPALGMKNGSNTLLLLAATRVGAGPGAVAAEKVVGAIRAIAARGAELNGVNARGQAAMHIAAQSGAGEIVRALVELGADVNVKDRSGKTALELVSGPGQGRREDMVGVLRELGAK